MSSHKQLSKPFLRHRCKKKIVYSCHLCLQDNRDVAPTLNLDRDCSFPHYVFGIRDVIIAFVIRCNSANSCNSVFVNFCSITFMKQTTTTEQRVMGGNIFDQIKWKSKFVNRVRIVSSIIVPKVRHYEFCVDKLTIYQMRNLLAWSLEIALRFPLSTFFQSFVNSKVYCKQTLRTISKLTTEIFRVNNDVTNRTFMNIL